MSSRVSGFSFIHNAIESGYPIVEAVDAVSKYVDEMMVVDMESTDGTRTLLESLHVTILPGRWMPGENEHVLDAAHEMHGSCHCPTIWFFEADEVFGPDLALGVANAIQNGRNSIAVHRIQLEQNFQRVRWYPDLVHRVFPKGKVKRSGHTTVEHLQGTVAAMRTEAGYLWDFPVMCRDDWMPRMKVQGELWGHPPRYRLTPYHFTLAPWELTEEEAIEYLNSEIWTWRRTPFTIPPTMLPYLGRTKYR